MANTSLQLHAPWQEVKEKIKETNPQLTDADLAYTPGKEEELIQRLQQKMNRSRDEVKAFVESISSNKGKAS